MANYDVIVIGSGPGGYVAAIRSAQLGMKTALVEKYPSLGGTCLNVGCIPSKTLLDTSEHYFNANKNFSSHGISLEKLKIDLSTLNKRKNKIISDSNNGIKYLMKKNKIDTYNGIASFLDNKTIQIKGDKITKITSKNAIIASGSKPIELPNIKNNKNNIITSTEILDLDFIPESLNIIGGGAIGIELGVVYARFGTKVSVIEYLDSIVPSMDREIGKELKKYLSSHLGFEFYLSSKVLSAENKPDKTVDMQIENYKGEKINLSSDICLISVGRKPYTEGLNLKALGIETDSKGAIITNENLQTTNNENIYAIGDVIKGPMLAHKAEDEGIFVAETIAGQKPHIDYNLIPNVIYTNPEVASVGKTEEQLKEHNIDYKVGKFPMKALGRARVSNDTEGLVKVLASSKDDEILGVHMMSARSADLIAEAVLAMEYKASSEDIAIISHAHPTFAEAIKEAALSATDNRPIHL